MRVSEPSAIGNALVRYVSERENPHNKSAVSSVELAIPATFLSQGIILIDTPGIGSTFLHNTAAAEAVVPDCDAAVFVLSADPPITDIEAAYLKKIREVVPKLIFILNKVDLLTKEERLSVESFLFNELKQRIPEFEPGSIFSISARAGVEAKARRDKVAFEASGVPSLQSFLAGELAREKSAIVSATGLRRSISLVGELLFQSEFEQKVLLLPQVVLQEKRQSFESAAAQFEVERQTLADVLSVDRTQLFRELESETDRLWQDARADLRTLTHEAIAQPVEEARKKLSTILSTRFEDSFQRALSLFHQKITERLSVHQDRAAKLVESVRQAAADLMEIPLVDIDPEEILEIKHEPYWVAPETPPSITTISTTALIRLLPAALRANRERKQFIRDAEAAVLRNVANLDWAIRQNINDAFNRFEFSLGQQFAGALAATREAILMAVQRRRDRTKECEAQIEEGSRAIDRLSRTLEALNNLNLGSNPLAHNDKFAEGVQLNEQ